MTPGRSGLCYFSNGRIMAILLRLGSFVWLNDALHMRTMTRARTSLARLTIQVGSGSSSHCFATDCFKMEATSSVLRRLPAARQKVTQERGGRRLWAAVMSKSNDRQQRRGTDDGCTDCSLTASKDATTSEWSDSRGGSTLTTGSG